MHVIIIASLQETFSHDYCHDKHNILNTFSSVIQTSSTIDQPKTIAPYSFDFGAAFREMFSSIFFQNESPEKSTDESLGGNLSSSLDFYNNFAYNDCNEKSLCGEASMLAADSFISKENCDYNNNLKNEISLEQDLFSSNASYVNLATQTSIRPICFISPKICNDCWYVLEKFLKTTSIIINVGEQICPVIALYFFYIAPSETLHQQTENNKFSGIFMTISFFCSTIKSSPKHISALGNKIISCCGAQVEETHTNDVPAQESVIEV
ncbi:MAG: hypothetical protein Q8S21_02290 [Candidatus Paracaedibacteraceae bacterium]|nr:hypothetical protein [Candidatus Paracaedibacteraceae bacterium]